jgi:hypothetical protein
VTFHSTGEITSAAFFSKDPRFLLEFFVSVSSANMTSLDKSKVTYDFSGFNSFIFVSG